MRAMDHSVAADVDWVIGACQCYPRAVFDELGGYTVFSRFGSEDIDFCLRVRLSGRRVRYVPSAVILHCEQRIARRPTRALTYSHLASLIKFFRCTVMRCSANRSIGESQSGTPISCARGLPMPAPSNSDMRPDLMSSPDSDDR
jgi:hypothetical protein